MDAFDDFKAINPLWGLSDPLTVRQTAALIAGFDPNAVCVNSDGRAWFESPTGLSDTDGIGWFQTAFAALTNAINAGRLKATIRRSAWERGWDEDPGEGERFASKVRVLESDASQAYETQPPGPWHRSIIYRVAPDWNLTTVAVDDLRDWLTTRGITTGFFFPEASDNPDYLNRAHSRYAPKLAAAVRAWQAVTDPAGKSPKQALTKWLREHASDYALTDDEGKVNELGIDEVAKVANWQPTGGAPKTPG